MNTNNILLSEHDLKTILPYLGNCVHFDIKDFGRRKGREILLEYNNGDKFIGNLDARTFKLERLKGLQSIVSYFARGQYGSNAYRGNCSGLLVKDLLEHFEPSFVIDPMAGSGTVEDVCKDLKVPCMSLDLNPKYGGFDAYKYDLPRSSKFVFAHLPYMVYEGSSMPQYSGVMWGNEKLPTDGSHIHDPELFTAWFNQVVANLYRGLRVGGRLVLLMGNSRYKGKFYSMYKNMNLYGNLECVIAKAQYNCMSDSMNYKGKSKFIPTIHEDLVILRKDHEFSIPCLIVTKTVSSILTSIKSTWRAIMQSIVEHYGGKITRDALFAEMQKHPKAKGNNTLRNTMRRELNTHPEEFIQDDNLIRLSAA